MRVISRKRIAVAFAAVSVAALATACNDSGGGSSNNNGGGPFGGGSKTNSAPSVPTGKTPTNVPGLSSGGDSSDSSSSDSSSSSSGGFSSSGGSSSSDTSSGGLTSGGGLTSSSSSSGGLTGGGGGMDPACSQALHIQAGATSLSMYKSVASQLRTIANTAKSSSAKAAINNAADAYAAGDPSKVIDAIHQESSACS